MSTKYIGLVLRARRKEILLSQIEIGEILDVATSTICMVENGQRTIALHRIQDYLQAYQLSSNCYSVFVKLLYPFEWEQQLVLKRQLGEDWQEFDNKVEMLINSGQFR